jgi:predicted Zn-dependent peptidase
MLLNAKLETAEINRERGVILEEMNMYRDNPMMYIEDVFEECLYGNTPAGWDTIGTKETILRVGRKDFVNYFSNQYAPHNTFVLLAGNIPGSIKKNNYTTVQKYFSSLKFSSRGVDFREKEAVKEKQVEPNVKTHYKKTDQAHLSLGVRTFGYNHKDRMLSSLLSVILGGSMSSRLFINLRERKGLAYYVRTNSEFYTDSGYLTTRAGVPTTKLEEAIKIILLEYRKLKKTLVSRTELKRAKDMLKGRLTIQLEASDNQANWYARQAVMLDTIARTDKQSGKTSDAGRPISDALRLVSPEDYFKRIEKITANDLKRVANDIFKSQGLNLALIGPYKKSSNIKTLLHF